MASAETESKPAGEEGATNPEHINLKVIAGAVMLLIDTVFR